MGILSKFFRKKEKENENIKEIKSGDFEIPDSFELSAEDVREFVFMNAKTRNASPQELAENGEEIDREIAEYMQSLKAKILSRNLCDFGLKAIHVKKPPYVNGSIDTSLGLKENEKVIELREMNRCHFNPSQGVAIQVVLDMDKIPLGYYLFNGKWSY